MLLIPGLGLETTVYVLQACVCICDNNVYSSNELRVKTEVALTPFASIHKSMP